jgi:hypothetical protein
MDQGQHGNDPIFGNLGLTGRKLGALLFYCLTLWFVSSNPGGSSMLCAIGGTILAAIASKMNGPKADTADFLLVLVAVLFVPMFLAVFVAENSNEFSPLVGAFWSSLIGTTFLPLRKSIRTSWWVNSSRKEITEWKVFKYSDHRVFREPHPFPNAQMIRYSRHDIHPKYKVRIEVKVGIGSTWEHLWNAAEVCAWAIRDDKQRYIVGFDPDPSDPKTLILRTSEGLRYLYNSQTEEMEEIFPTD